MPSVPKVTDLPPFASDFIRATWSKLLETQTIISTISSDSAAELFLAHEGERAGLAVPSSMMTATDLAALTRLSKLTSLITS